MASTRIPFPQVFSLTLFSPVIGFQFSDWFSEVKYPEIQYFSSGSKNLPYPFISILCTTSLFSFFLVEPLVRQDRS